MPVLFAGIGVLLIYTCIALFPTVTQLTKKGNLYVIGGALIVALATYASFLIVPLWQSSLVLILLSGLVTTVMHRTVVPFSLPEGTHFHSNVPNENNESEMEKELQISAKELLETDDVKEKEEVPSTPPIPNELDIAESLETFNPPMDSISDQQELITETLSPHDTERLEDGANQLEEPIEWDIIDEGMSYTEAISPEELLVAHRNETDHNEQYSMNDLNVQEELGNEEEQLVVEELLLHRIDTPFLEERLYEADEKEESSEAADLIKENPEEDEGLVWLDEDTLEPLEESLFSLTENLERNVEVGSDLDAADDNPETGVKSALKQRNPIQEMMFLTFIRDIQLKQETLSSLQYEHYIQQFLHDSLPDQEYLTFATMLMQHYTNQMEYTKLASLTGDLRTKYDNSPLLLQHIELYEQQCLEYV